MESANTPRRAICSYFRTQWQNSDIDEIKQHGFNTVLLCVTEDMLQQRPQYALSVANHARSIGLEVWGDLWGFGKVFGGEADSPFSERRTPHHDDPEFNELIGEGIEFIASLGAKAIFWDEPHFKDCSCCKGSEANFILNQASKAKDCGLLNSVCLTSSRANMASLDHLASQPQIDDIATDPYYANFPGTNQNDTPDNYVGCYAANIRQIANRHTKTGHIWVQGFSLPEGHEKVPLMATRAARRAGIESLGFWGFRACKATPVNTPAKPDRIWHVAKQVTSLR